VTSLAFFALARSQMQVRSNTLMPIFCFHSIGSTSFIFQDILVSASAPVNFSIQL